MGYNIIKFPQKAGGEVISVSEVDDAINLLSRPNQVVDEIICGSFGGFEDSDWNTIQKEAKDRGVKKFTLLSGDVDSRRLKSLKTRGVNVINKYEFDEDAFLEERFPTRDQIERR